MEDESSRELQAKKTMDQRLNLLYLSGLPFGLYYRRIKETGIPEKYPKEGDTQVVQGVSHVTSRM